MFMLGGGRHVSSGTILQSMVTQVAGGIWRNTVTLPCPAAPHAGCSHEDLPSDRDSFHQVAERLSPWHGQKGTGTSGTILKEHAV